MINLKEKYNVIKKWFLNLPLWQRAIITSFAGAIGGSSIIGFFNQYALYYHAYRQGFRVPVEGVEYLNFAISLISFLFILISILGTIVVYNGLKLFSKFVLFSYKDLFIGNKRKRLWIMWISLIICIVTYCLNVFNPEWNKLIRAITISISATAFGIFSFNFNHMFLAPYRRILTSSIVVLFLLFILASLFNQKLYSNFLSIMQYGGNIPIEIEYRKADNTEEHIGGLLLLKSKDSYIYKNVISNNHGEIPVERVSKVTFLKD